MKTLLFLSAIFTLSHSAIAALKGEFELVKGPKAECPSGLINVMTDEKTKERNLIFGSSHSWFMNEKNISQTTEVVPEGCTYTVDYEYSENNFKAKTVRTKCPINKENAVITESIVLVGNKLTYEFESVPKEGKKISFSCHFNRAK